MCFSTAASFTASGILLVTGVVALINVKHSKQLALASIPVLFSIQQFTEGVLWLSLTNSELLHWKTVSTYVFVLFAYVVWPTWVPLSFWLIEKGTDQRKILKLIFLIGFALSLFLGFCIFNFDISSQISNCHIKYQLILPKYLQMIGHIFYFVAIIIPPFLSQQRWTIILGFLNVIAYSVSKLYFHDNVFSVWCFFAAIISVCVVMILRDLNKNAIKEKQKTTAVDGGL